MNKQRGRILLFLILTVAAGLGTARPEETAKDRSRFRTGLGFDLITRTLNWDDGEGQSKLRAYLITVRQDIAPGENLRLTLAAGLSLSSFNGLVFRDLPISVEYQAGAAKALALGAEIRGLLLDSGDFEIEGVVRIVSSIGMNDSWPLEGFAVDGEMRGRPFWAEISAGPRVTYTLFGRFRPSVLVSGTYLWGDFKMDQTLGELVGTEKKAVKGKSVVYAAFGADYELGPRTSLKGEAGFLPYRGGIDARLSLGISYAF